MPILKIQYKVSVYFLAIYLFLKTWRCCVIMIASHRSPDRSHPVCVFMRMQHSDFFKKVKRKGKKTFFFSSSSSSFFLCRFV